MGEHASGGGENWRYIRKHVAGFKNTLKTENIKTRTIDEIQEIIPQERKGGN